MLLLLAAAAALSPIQLADPMVGTDGHGHAFPGATAPFGMVQVSPDTRTDTWDGCSGYHYSDHSIIGFSHTHLSGTGVGCMGDILLMPSLANDKRPVGWYRTAFDHKDEKASPGFYSVKLANDIRVEVTATERAGYHRYSYPSGRYRYFVIDLRHGIQNSVRETSFKADDSKTSFSGYRASDGWGGRRKVYYYIECSEKVVSTYQTSGLGDKANRMRDGDDVTLVELGFGKGDAPIEVRVGISATSVEDAKKNLQAEIPTWDFSGTRKKTEAAWSKALGKIDTQFPDTATARTFYSNLYLSLLAPNIFNNADGSYLGFDHKVHANPGYTTYSTFSLWDTFRAEHPLLNLIEPQRAPEFVNSLVAQYRESGLKTTPIWPLWNNETYCMIGRHALPVIAEAYAKGFKGFEAEKAYQALKETQLANWREMPDYGKYGYLPSRPGRQATSITLELAYNDWCVAKMAEMLGHKEDAAMFYSRAANFRNVYDRTTRTMRGRLADGGWRRPFNPFGLINDEYTEANSWQYMFFAPQDVYGLMDTYGGQRAFNKRLDDLFTASTELNTSLPDISGLVGQYAHGNEPCHHVAYLSSMTGEPWKTQQRVREVASKYYSEKPDGQCGNIDCGQMSAWYVFTALGFYPVNPVSDVYVLGSPMVTQATIGLGNGKNLVISAPGASLKNIYVQSAKLNGKPLDRAWITYKEIMAGAKLEFTMGSKPNQKWGSTALPPKTMPAGFKYPALPTPADDRPVTLKLPIRVASALSEPAGDFIPDPNALEGSTNGTDHMIDRSAPNAGPEAMYQNERYGRNFAQSFKVPAGEYLVRLHFAETFDGEIGMRRFDVLINGKVVLANFDVLKEAGAMHKAVVREFKSIRPGKGAAIEIRIKATPDSPDQNAKINGIEIVPMTSQN
ncbi:MAG: GH92 family glycosyl hydrolase [Armatimonadetes bacterium]|nr:GH92 family glycosyl hydrolase [Armatimonadota bacterium]